MTEIQPSPEVINVRIPSRLDLLSLLDKVTQVICERMAFDETTCSQVTMSVIEAGTNAIQHGHHRDPNKTVDVVYTVHEDRVEITVHDFGNGFDPGSVNGDVTAPEHLLDARGRGIFIMKACMDQVDFSFGPNGTVCRLVKRRPPVHEPG